MDPETASSSFSPDPDGPGMPDGDAGPSAVPGVFRERFDSLLPRIQKQWPEVARQTLEASRGSFETVVELISRQSGATSAVVRQQLTELLQVTTEQASQMAENLRPLEEQLEGLLDELNASLRPRIEKPVRDKPLLALGVAAGFGLLVGLLLSSGRRSA